MSQTPIYDELIATLAKPKDDASTSNTPTRAKTTRSAAAHSTAGDAAAESAVARKNRRHRADP